MVRYGRWLLVRHRRQFMGWVELTIYGLQALPTALLIAIAALYLDLSRAEYALWLVSVISGSIVSTRLGLWSISSRLRPIRDWVRDDPAEVVDAVAAWDAALWFSYDGPRRSIVAAAPIQAACVLGTVSLLGVPGRGVAWLAVNLVFASLILTHNLGIASRSLVRPLIEELAPHVPVGATSSAPRMGVVQLVGTSFGAVGLVVGLAVPLVVLGTGADLRDFVLAGVGAVVIGSIVALDSISRVARPLVEPLRDLLAAAQRVERGDLSEPVIVSSVDEFGDLAQAFNAMQRGLRERESLHAAFGSYVDPALAQRLVESGSAVFEGEDLIVTVMFVDVRDFTAYSEGVSPAEAVELLNRLFDVVVPVLHQHGGHANHYLGDGLLAIFGAPQPLEEHASAAVAAALEIQQRVRAAFGTELQLGIGINTGPVIAGTVGGGGRHEFTVIGDTVNTAARVEQLTKVTGDPILLTEATRAALASSRPRSTRRGAFDLKGKAAKVTVHALNPFPRSRRRG